MNMSTNRFAYAIDSSVVVTILLQPHKYLLIYRYTNQFMGTLTYRYCSTHENIDVFIYTLASVAQCHNCNAQTCSILSKAVNKLELQSNLINKFFICEKTIFENKKFRTFVVHFSLAVLN